MAEKKKAPRITSPKGTFRYPYLVTPDRGSKEHPKPDGEFKTQLIVRQDDPAVQDFLKKLQPFYEQAIEEGEEKFKGLKIEQRKKLKELKVTDLYQIEYDKETEEPTGNIIFKFSTKASGTNDKGERWERKIPLFNAKGEPLKLKQVGGGTIGRVSFEVGPYFVAGTGTAGLKLYLVAAKILELRTFQGGSASDYGFGGDEDGDYDAIESDLDADESDHTPQSDAGEDEEF